MKIDYSLFREGVYQRLGLPDNFPNLKVLVLGFGESGQAMVKWLAAAGFQLLVADTRKRPLSISDFSHAEMSYIFEADFSTIDFSWADLILMSPGISIEKGVVADRLGSSGAMATCWGELDLFDLLLSVLAQTHAYHPKKIGITGSNGKTTVTALTHHLCQNLGLKSLAAGNISPAMLTALWDSLLIGVLPDVWVLELSSFQLASSVKFHLDVSVVLNVSEDHLDWHDSMQSYRQAKNKIYHFSDVGVVNLDEPFDAEIVLSTKKIIHFSLVSSRVARWGVKKVDELVFLGCFLPTGFIKVLSIADLRVHGAHNVSNVLASLSLCEGAGLFDVADTQQVVQISQGLQSYEGEPHRVQWVVQHLGIDFFDDSKGTNIGATQAAIKGLSAKKGQKFDLFLIVGGDGKGQNFSDLARDLIEGASGVALIGRDAPEIAGAIDAKIQEKRENGELVDMTYQVVGHLDAAVCLLWDWAIAKKNKNVQERKKQGVAVLLSPACASFDQFRGYVHRAEVFRQVVFELISTKR